MQADFPIFGGYSTSNDIGLNSEDLINMFMLTEPTGKKKFALLGTPGLGDEISVHDGVAPSRALYVYENPIQESMFGVFGGDVYRFTAPIVSFKVGTLDTTQGFISVSSNNGDQAMFVDGISAYVYNVRTGVYTKVTAAGLPSQPLNVAFLDGFFIVPYGTENAFGISAPNNGLVWDALDKGSLEAYSGKNVGVGVVNRRAFFFKTSSTEVWYNAGAADFPLRPDRTSLFNFGCKSVASIQSAFGYLFWLANDVNGVGSVMVTTGDAPKRISNEAVESLIATFTASEDVSCYIYKDIDHIIYSMNWTTDDVTLEYDLTMDMWFRKEMHRTLVDQNVPYSGKARFLANCHAYFNNKHYIGSYKKSSLYEMSRDYATYSGEQIRRVRVCPHFFDKNYRMIQINSLQIDMRTGIGLPTAPQNVGVDPKMYLRISRDGKPFGNYHAKSVGKVGNRSARVMFRNLGIARDFVAELSFYDPVIPVSILGASINYEVLSK